LETSCSVHASHNGWLSFFESEKGKAVIGASKRGRNSELSYPRKIK
jgi:hypothetical protein